MLSLLKDVTNYGQTTHRMAGLALGVRHTIIVGSINSRFSTAAWSEWAYLTTARGRHNVRPAESERRRPQTAAGIANGRLALGAIRRVVMKIADRIYQRAAGPIEAEGEARGIAQGEAQSEARGIARGEALGIARALDWARRKAYAERGRGAVPRAAAGAYAAVPTVGIAAGADA